MGKVLESPRVLEILVSLCGIVGPFILRLAPNLRVLLRAKSGLLSVEKNICKGIKVLELVYALVAGVVIGVIALVI